MTSEVADWIVFGFMYVMLGGLWAAAGEVIRRNNTGDGRRLGARMTLLTPVWPIALIGVAAQGAVRWVAQVFKEAFGRD